MTAGVLLVVAATACSDGKERPTPKPTTTTPRSTTTTTARVLPEPIVVRGQGGARPCDAPVLVPSYLPDPYMKAIREEAVGNADWQMSFASSHGELKVRIAGDPSADSGSDQGVVHPRVRNSQASAGRSAGKVDGPKQYAVTWEEGRCPVGYQVTGNGISRTDTIKVAQSLRWQEQPPRSLEYRVTPDGSESVVQPLDAAVQIPRFVETQGRVLTYRDGAVTDPEYAMTEVVGSGSMLWLSRYIGHEPDGRPRAHLLDSVDVPVPDSRFRLDVEGCSSAQIEEKPQPVNGSAEEPDYIVAVVRFGDTPSTRYKSVEVAAAWHADVASLKLVSLDPASVTCVDEEGT